MTDMVIPPDSVIAAAEAMRDAFGAGKDDYEVASAALKAALPHLRPAACTCPTDADVTPDMRSETGQHLSGCPFGGKGLAAWMDEQIERIDETKALVETATRLGRELGRREAAEEITAVIEKHEDDARRAEAHSRDRVWFYIATGYMRSAELAREIATREPK